MDKNTVAIATFVSNNYGTCLQAFALKQAVEKLGYEATIYSFRNKKSNNMPQKRILGIISLLVRNNPIKLLRFLSARKYWKMNDCQFKIFIEKYLSPQDGLKLTDDTIKSFMCAITGSDMVWSPEYRDSLDSYFLQWISQAKRIAYAPSFGSTDVGVEIQERYRYLIQGIHRLSCREKSGCDFIKTLTGLDSKLVCDPTLLFDDTEWLKILPIKRETEKCILVNCFGGLSNSDARELKKIADCKGFAVHYLNIGIAETLNEADSKYEGYGPLQFLSLSRNSQFQIVNGYHGLLFALIFNKPFVVLHRYGDDHWGTHEKRMADLLDYLGLLDRYITSLSEIKEEYFTLDYTETNQKIMQLRQESWNYLSESLNQYNNDKIGI